MSARTHTAARAATSLAHPARLNHLVIDEEFVPQALADDQICDILAASGRPLWYCCTVADAQRLAVMRRAEPNVHPDWRGPLSLRVMDVRTPRGSRHVQHTLLRYADGLPLGGSDGCEPLLHFTGGTFGLGSDWYNEEIHVACGAWSAAIDLQLMLFNLDRFDEPSRRRLTLEVEWIFGVQLVRGAA